MTNIRSCIVCGDSGYSYVENPILFCYNCKGNLNEEQMMRIQRALQNSDLTEFRQELQDAKRWSENMIGFKDEIINKLNNEIKQLKSEKANQYNTIQNYQNKIDDFRNIKPDGIIEDLIKELNYANKLRRQIEWERLEKIDTTLHAKALEDTLFKIDTIKKKITNDMSQTASNEGNIKLLRRAQELGMKAELELFQLKKALALMRENVDHWLRDNTKYDATPTISMHDYFMAVDLMIKQLEEIYEL